MTGKIEAGCRVTVPFGATKTYTALVVKIHNERPDGEYKIKEIIALLDEKPIVTIGQFNFWSWIAQYYMCSLGEVFKAAIPSNFRIKSQPEKHANIHQACLPMDDFQVPLKKLNKYQQKALGDIDQSFLEQDITLLHGVTSSGKTELYIHLIYKYMRAGKQVLYLLPEIALTTQITERLRNVFGDRLGVYHSKFTDKERRMVYEKQLSDTPYQLILGVRSSIFLPFGNLGLVIVDEEHETSYKQQDPAPRYHARNSAIILAKQLNAKVLLGTATPSLESYYMSQKGKYGYVQLTHRYQDLQLPDIEVVDIVRLRKQKKMKGAFSPVLIEAIKEALEKKEQIILFQNRRGFSNFVQCKNCGWVPKCERCDVSLTYHKQKNLLTCHYCGKQYSLPQQCPQCEEHEFMYMGLGTEKIEDQIHKLFPDAKVSRMDLDTAKTRKEYEEIISNFSNYKCDILIGTQMVSKGLDFDNVSVVGIIDADSMLNLPDFRSYERSFHVLAQVAGRAGRRYHTGKVILQTRSADLPLLQNVVSNDYLSMYVSQLAERKLFNYPPLYRLIYIYLKHRDSERVDACAEYIVSKLKNQFGDNLLGPDCPPVSRVHSMSLRKIVVKLKTSDSPAKVRKVLNNAKQDLIEQTFANGINIFFDVDPL